MGPCNTKTGQILLCPAYDSFLLFPQDFPALPLHRKRAYASNEAPPLSNELLFSLKKNKKAAHLFTPLTKQDLLPYLLHSFHPKKAETIQHLQSGARNICFLSVTLKRGPHQEIGKKAERF